MSGSAVLQNLTKARDLIAAGREFEAFYALNAACSDSTGSLRPRLWEIFRGKNVEPPANWRRGQPGYSDELAAFKVAIAAAVESSLEANLFFELQPELLQETG